MPTPSTQIKINLSRILDEKLEQQADYYGLTKADYVKHLIVNDVKGQYQVDAPIYEASSRVVKAYQRAKQEEKQGKLTKVSNITDFMKKL